MPPEPRGDLAIDPRSTDLTPAELRAIEEHMYFLSLERGAEVSIETAIEDFLCRFVNAWRRQKTRHDLLEQRTEIERHCYLRSEAQGCDIGRAAAAAEWCERYASIWRAERESLERNGFLCTSLAVRPAAGLEFLPWAQVARLASRFDCDVYVHASTLPYWNFRLASRPFMNVKSLIGALSQGVAPGDVLEFIATGREAAPALAALHEQIEASSLRATCL